VVGPAKRHLGKTEFTRSLKTTFRRKGKVRPVVGKGQTGLPALPGQVETAASWALKPKTQAAGLPLAA